MNVCAGLRQVLADVVEEVRRSISPDIDGAEVLHSLLSAPWLQSLLRVRIPPPPFCVCLGCVCARDLTW